MESLTVILKYYKNVFADALLVSTWKFWKRMHNIRKNTIASGQIQKLQLRTSILTLYVIEMAYIMKDSTKMGTTSGTWHH